MAILNKIDDESISDTVEQCRQINATAMTRYAVGRYLRGAWKPHYPVPAIPAQIDWTDSSEGYSISLSSLLQRHRRNSKMLGGRL